MKEFDNVRVTNDNEEYKKARVYKNMVGYIGLPEIRDDSFFVIFIDENFEKQNNPEWFYTHFNELKEDICCVIKIKDLELIKDNGLSDEALLEDLPKHDPKWWCKVENGYIMNLLGEKKNKIPYDYNS